MMYRWIVPTLFACIAATGQAQTINKVCSWGVLSNFAKATAASQHCTMYAGPNGFRPENPKRSQWINDCMGLVNGAIAACADTDLQCQKDRIRPLQGAVCALNDKYSN